jgi:ssDNA-specific exonuclease RecJ
LAEHKTENLGVVGSIPTEATSFLLKIFIALNFITMYALIAQLDRAFDYGSKG